MKIFSLQDRIVWLDLLIGSIFISLAALILQLFSKSKRDRSSSDRQLHLIGAILLAAVGFLLRPNPRTNRTIQKRE